ncbi:MAG: hypothetical protein V4510_03860 [bacterium]
MKSWAVLLVALVAAGCMQSATPAHDASAPTRVDRTDLVTVFPQGRTDVAAVSFHSYFGWNPSGSPFNHPRPPPLDFNLTYNGIQLVYDEYGRSLPAYVYNTVDWIWVSDGNGDPLHDTGKYELQHYEYHFDIADGHLIGVVDPDVAFHVLLPPFVHLPIADPSTIFMAIHAVHGDLTKEIAIISIDGITEYLGFQPAKTTFRPLTGDCALWEFRLRIDPEPQSTPVKIPPTEGKVKHYHTLFCLESGSLFPLWFWSGSEEDGGDAVVRTSQAVLPPPLEGTVLPPLRYENATWTEVSAPAPLDALVGPTLVPPSGAPDDWPGMMADRVKALYLSPDYLTFRKDSAEPWTRFVLMDLPFQDTGITVLGIPIPPRNTPLSYDNMTLFLSMDTGTQSHYHEVYTHHGPPEQGDTHRAALEGGTSLSDTDVTAKDVPKMPTGKDLMDHLGVFVAPGPTGSIYFFMSPYDGPKGREWFAEWLTTRPCWGNLPGTLLFLDALDGYVYSVERFAPGSETCQDMANNGARPAAPDLLRGVLQRMPFGPDVDLAGLMPPTPAIAA